MLHLNSLAWDELDDAARATATGQLFEDDKL
jgi:hypothetical protein